MSTLFIFHNHLAKLQSKATSVGLSTRQLISVRLVVAKAGSDRCKLPLGNAESDKEEEREATARLAATSPISKDAAVAAVFHYFMMFSE